MKLRSVIEKLSGAKVLGDPEKEFARLTFDSRDATRDAMFIAVRGTSVDGHDYIGQAIENGTSIIVCEAINEPAIDDVTFLKVQDSRESLGIIASHFYGDPSNELHLVGVTGTNG